MRQLLQINSSLFAETSVSNQIAKELLAQLAETMPQISISCRDIAAEGVPHLDAAYLQAINTPANEQTAKQAQQSIYSQNLIDEVQAADILLIGAPMYNFSVPSVLKAWFDHIARAGITFEYTAEGPKGLLQNKTAYVITTRGGLHKDKASDTQVPYIKNMLAFLGIEDVHFIYAEGLNMGDHARENGLQQARNSIVEILAA
ncbi:MAG: NAD(P)H-dependent oxidoreductase [Gammaproteobacteria bacterium]|nr:NAD(P)H-dependent oxidoreductase [Gammaproteobacteria bacterium]